MFRVRASKRGFTLLELIIVMAVITVILSAVIPNLRSMQQEGQLSKAEKELLAVKAAVTSYWKNNAYVFPPDIQNSLVNSVPQILMKPAVDPFSTNGTTFGYLKGDDANFGTYFIAWTKGPKGDTAQPTFMNGTVIFSGSGFATSNAPVKRQ